MTAQETIHLIRSVLDDGLFWYLGWNEINRCVNQAQLKLIDKYHGLDDERALRPLYRRETVAYDGVLTNELLYPRAARIYIDSDPAMDSWCVEYLTYGLFINYNSPGIVYNTAMPRSAYWTFQNRYNPAILGIETHILFSLPPNTPTANCECVYIAKPAQFLYLANNPANNPLSVPDEYHTEVALLAAEMCNTIDVGEQERGEIAVTQMGQRLTLENSGGG